jgi:hypothetical protein
MADTANEVSIACKIVCIHLFFTDNSVILTVVLIDSDGKTFEAKSRSPDKAYYVYFNFDEDQNVLLECKPDSFTQVNQEFSQAKCETWQTNWTFCPLKYEIQLKNFFPVLYDIEQFHSSSKPVRSIVATFVKMGGGPIKYGSNGTIIARGHFVKFRDARNLLFNALVWENAKKNFVFPLYDCDEGDYVLLPYAREQSEEYRSSKIYTVTTLYPPVVQSRCINKSKAAEALEGRSEYYSDIYNPYE